MSLTKLPAGHAPTGSELSTLYDAVNGLTDPYSFRLSLTSTSVANATDTRITWTNVASNGVTVSSSNRITFNLAGRWQLRLSLRYATGGTAGTEAMAAIRRYDSLNTLQEILANNHGAASNGVAVPCAAGSMTVGAGDYIEAWTFQSSGGAKTPEAGPTVGYGWTMFEGYWLGNS